MISQPFQYHAPSALADATHLLDTLGNDVAILGGGTMLVPSMSANQVRCRHVIGLTALRLDTISRDATHVSIGAMTTYAQLLSSPLIAQSVPLLRLMTEQVTGGPSIWNQGTLGGSAAYANPASDAPGCLTALEASFELQSIDGTRTVCARDFYLAAFRTARRANELLVAIHIPLRAGVCVSQYDKHKSCASSWPIVTVACSVHVGQQVAVHLAVGAAATRPAYGYRLVDMAELSSADEWINEMAMYVTHSLGEGWTDELADATYRRAIVPAVVKRNLKAVLARVRS